MKERAGGGRKGTHRDGSRHTSILSYLISQGVYDKNICIVMHFLRNEGSGRTECPRWLKLWRKKKKRKRTKTYGDHIMMTSNLIEFSIILYIFLWVVSLVLERISLIRTFLS